MLDDGAEDRVQVPSRHPCSLESSLVKFSREEGTYRPDLGSLRYLTSMRQMQLQMQVGWPSLKTVQEMSAVLRIYELRPRHDFHIHNL